MESNSSKRPARVVEDELDCLFESQLAFCGLKSVLKLVKSPLFGKLAFKHYHMSANKRKAESSSRDESNDESNEAEADSLDVGLLRKIFTQALQTSLHKNPFDKEFRLEDLERSLSVLLKKASQPDEDEQGEHLFSNFNDNCTGLKLGYVGTRTSRDSLLKE